jgi:hypothetical protein
VAPDQATAARSLVVPEVRAARWIPSGGRVDVRLIDTKSGEILGTFKDEEETADSSVKVAGGGSTVDYDEELVNKVYEPIVERIAPKVVKKLGTVHAENLVEDEEEDEAPPPPKKVAVARKEDAPPPKTTAEGHDVDGRPDGRDEDEHERAQARRRLRSDRAEARVDNLLSNAVKYGGPDPAAHIELSAQERRRIDIEGVG